MGRPSLAELQSLRDDVAALACSLPCAIQRKTRVKDGLGTETDKWATISPDDLKCGVTEPSAGQLQNYDYKIGSLATWLVKLPYQTDVAIQDHLVIQGPYGEQTLVVQVLLEPRSYATLTTVLASEVKS